MYFESWLDWEKQVDADFKNAKLIADKTFKALNQMSDRWSYTVPLKDMLHSYFSHSL